MQSCSPTPQTDQGGKPQVSSQILLSSVLRKWPLCQAAPQELCSLTLARKTLQGASKLGLDLGLGGRAQRDQHP